MKSNAFEQLALFVTVALLTIPLLISCKKTSSSEEKQKENAALSNSSVQTEQLNENSSKDEEILVIINGTQVNLGELTLENLLQKSGLTRISYKKVVLQVSIMLKLWARTTPK